MGKVLVIKHIITHHRPNLLPTASETTIPVQLYGSHNPQDPSFPYIGNQVEDTICRLGKRLSPETIDFLTFSMAVTAADTFMLRSTGADNWTRQIALTVPLHEPDKWKSVTGDLESMLHFLSGDMWSLEFTAGGFRPPRPYIRRQRYRMNYLYPSNCVSLFSGGIDSTVGVVDILSEGLKPTLVSHAYQGDAKHQNLIWSKLPRRTPRLAINLDPKHGKETEISMRTRSLNFLALALLACDAVNQLNHLNKVDLYVPENGMISLNAPLTPRRIGSLSTRTTHPNFISSVQNLLDTLGVKVEIINPYQFSTKGEMILNCRDQELLESVIDNTVSCSHWKRNNKQCGYCVPCLVRRAAMSKRGWADNIDYQVNDLLSLSGEKRDDLFAVQGAIKRFQAKPSISTWISKSGPLPIEHLKNYETVFNNGILELEAFLSNQGLK